MAFCSGCGEKIEGGSQFCPKCGKAIGGISAGSQKQSIKNTLLLIALIVGAIELLGSVIGYLAPIFPANLFGYHHDSINKSLFSLILDLPRIVSSTYSLVTLILLFIILVLICAIIAVIFNIFAWKTNNIKMTLAAAIIYIPAGFIIPMVICFIAYGQIKKQIK